jgi:hypothetical protein
MTDIEHLAGLLRAAYAATGDVRYARAHAELAPDHGNALALERMEALMRDNPGLPPRSAAALVAGPDCVPRLVSLCERARASALGCTDERPA